MAFADKAKASQYIYQYTKGKYDRISLMVIKGDKAKYQAAADAAGQSLNAWIVDAIEAKMRENP